MKAKKIVALMLALVMVLALGASAFAATGDMSNPVTVSGVTLRFGDPNYPATAPEKYMYFKETGTGTMTQSTAPMARPRIRATIPTSSLCTSRATSPASPVRV